MAGEIRGEWDAIKQHDVLFLLTIRPPTSEQVGPSWRMWGLLALGAGFSPALGLAQ